MMKDMKWRLIIIAAVIGLSVWSFYPPSQKVRARPRPQGRRVPRPPRQDRRCAPAGDRDDGRAAPRRAQPRQRAVRESRRGQRRRNSGRRHPERLGVPRRGRRCRHLVRAVLGDERLFLPHEAEHRQSAAGQRRHPVARDHRAPGQRAGRCRADRRAVRWRGSDRRPASGCHRGAAREGDHSIDRAAQADARRPGPVPEPGSCAAGLQQRCATRCRDSARPPGRGRHGRHRGHGVLRR